MLELIPTIQPEDMEIHSKGAILILVSSLAGQARVADLNSNNSLREADLEDVNFISSSSGNKLLFEN